MTHIEKVKDLVVTEKRTVSVRDICHHRNVHVSEARRILDDFVSQEVNKESGQFNVTYILNGTGLDSPDDYKVHKLCYAKSDELDEVRKGFATVASCKVFSVSLKDQESTLKEEKEPLLDRETLLQHQRLTHIVNDDILLRPDRLERLKLVSGISVNGSNEEGNVEVKCDKKTESVKESKSEVKKETKSTNKRTTTNRRNTNKNNKQSKLSGFGTKVPKNEKTNSSADSGFSVESTPDPFTDDEEDKSPEREDEEEEMEVEPSPPSPSPPPSPEVKVESEDEAIVMEEVKRKVKKESKKRKRVMVYDSDDEDEEALAMRILAGGDDGDNSNHNDRSPEPEPEPEDEKPAKKSKKRSKPMEVKTVAEEYEDEDGYTQVRMVKKMIPIEEKVKSEDGGENDDKVKPQGKASHKKPRTDEDKEDKPKGKKLSKAAQAKKGQVSITSFFKPIST